MKLLPKIETKYWVSLFVASVFGADLGDFISDYLHLGNFNGLPFLAALLALIFIVEKTAVGTVMLSFGQR